MSKYNPNDFIEKINGKLTARGVPACPYCGGNKFTSTDSFASIIIGKELDNVSLGPSIPAGMLICEACGHVEFFALGALGLLNNEEAESNG